MICEIRKRYIFWMSGTNSPSIPYGDNGSIRPQELWIIYCIYILQNRTTWATRTTKNRTMEITWTTKRPEKVTHTHHKDHTWVLKDSRSDWGWQATVGFDKTLPTSGKNYNLDFCVFQIFIWNSCNITSFTLCVCLHSIF